MRAWWCQIGLVIELSACGDDARRVVEAEADAGSAEMADCDHALPLDEVVCVSRGLGRLHENVAICYAGQSPELLWRWVQDPESEDCWENALMGIGLLGDETDLEGLIRYIEEPLPVPRDEIQRFHTFWHALWGIAFLVGRHPDRSPGLEAEQYLINCAQNGYWQSRPGFIPESQRREDLVAHMQENCVFHLGHSRGPGARAALEALLADPATPNYPRLEAEHALERLDCIAEEDERIQHYADIFNSLRPPTPYTPPASDP